MKGDCLKMRTMLTLKRMFLGLNGMAIHGKNLNIEIKPKFDAKTGQPICTEWYLSGVDFDDKETCVKDFIAGINIDDDHNNVGVKFFDACGKYPRFIADRIPTNGAFLRKRTATTKSAFARLLTILQAYYPYLDSEALDILQDGRIMKVKCKIIYPLLVPIPNYVTTNQELLDHFLSLARPGEDKVRYFKKIIVLNGTRYWISNHIFHHSIKPFKELMIDLTGIDIKIEGETEEDAEANESYLKEQNDIQMARVKELFNALYEDSETIDDLILGMKDLINSSGRFRLVELADTEAENIEDENENIDEEEQRNIDAKNEKLINASSHNDSVPSTSTSIDNSTQLENMLGSVFGF